MADTVLGTVFAELLKVVTHVISKSLKYETELEKLKSILESITPLIQEIETLNIALNIPVQQTAKLKEELIKGTELVRKCSEVKCSCFKKVNYSDKLIKLNQSIERICRVDMLTQLIRDNKKILEKVEKIGKILGTEPPEITPGLDAPLKEVRTELVNDEEMQETIQTQMTRDNEEISEGVNTPVNSLEGNKKGGGVFNRVEIDGLCSAPDPPEITPGLDDPLKELRTELVKDEEMQEIIQTQMTRDDENISERVNTPVNILEGNKKGAGVFNRVEIGGPCSPPDPLVSTPGLDAPMKELKTELVKDDGMQVIVVSASGGAGKTTLVKKLCADDQVKDKFQENIFFITVSKTPDVKIIVQRIFQHKKREVPTFQTDEAAINDLERLLKSIVKAILLVLDDVWSESLVQKFKFRLPNYKILVTSRSIFPQFGSGYLLKPLNDEAAMIVFRSSVTPQDGKLSFFDEKLAKKILKVCKGSPLALTVVGRLLCGKPAVVWQSTVKEWDKGKSIFISGTGTELLVCLQSSLDALDEEVKECYLNLGSFPQDQRIPINALIDMWMELHEWVEDGLSAITYLHQLSSRCMVNLVIARENATDDGYYNDDFIMQHDLLRELIIHQSISQPVQQTKRLIIDISGNKFPKWWSEQKQNPIHARLLSISTDEKFSSSWCDLNAPEVEVVVLNLRTTEYTLPNFMQNMGKLKVLIVTNYGFLPSELSNFSLLGSPSLSNLKRIRLEHVSIPSFGLQMKNLQKISLVMCNVGQDFRNSNFQISNAFPNLLEFGIDYCNDLEELPDGLCDIVSLKKLNITNCHNLSTLPEDIGKLVNLEELRLTSCTDLSELPEMVAKLSNLKLLDISGCPCISKLTTQVGKLRSLETLCMIGCSSCKLPPSIKKLERLNLVKCDKETASQWETYKHNLPKLKVEVLKDDINLNFYEQSFSSHKTINNH
ncbi:hypothetical protein LWI28_004670 [Acer negundo]|uniref:RPW8 domain-containing protein n=1 Tax=Acer negundo TaxID=4023 RepID=A0AAD5IM07_ACENE|nr:hypothetical protein LWI28_004670 [Acer negundo]